MTSTESATLEVRQAGAKGVGLFALRTFWAGEAIADFNRLMQNGVTDLDPDSFLVIPWDGLGRTLVMPKADEPLYNLNHSCDPNAWLHENGSHLVSRRVITTGQEITVDYAAFEHEEDAVFDWECLCKSPVCRLQITGGDLGLLDSNFVGHITPFLRQRYQDE